MAALLLDGPAAAALTVQLDQVAADAARAYGLVAGPEVELHGHEIFHAAKSWKGVPPRARIGVFDDVVETDTRARKAKLGMWKRLEPRVEHQLCWFPAVDGQQSAWGRDLA